MKNNDDSEGDDVQYYDEHDHFSPDADAALGEDAQVEEQDRELDGSLNDDVKDLRNPVELRKNRFSYKILRESGQGGDIPDGLELHRLDLDPICASQSLCLQLGDN